MKQKVIRIGFIFLIISLFVGFTKQNTSLVLRGAYLGQKPPGLTPEIFAKGIISTEKGELNCVFTPDGNEIYLTCRLDGINTIMTLRQIEGRWSERKVASFSGKYSDVDPYITPDGKRLYFSSKRPLTKIGDAKDSDIWYVEKNSDNEWGRPVRLEEPNSIGKDDYYTSISTNGTLYFSIFEQHGSPGNLYFSKYVNDEFTKPVLLENPISTKFNDHDPFIAPDESYLIFTSNREGGFGKGDLYICYKNADGKWSEPINMGEKINTKGYDYAAMLSPDGRYLFFTRYINGNGDIYWVDAKIIVQRTPSENE